MSDTTAEEEWREDRERFVRAQHDGSAGTTATGLDRVGPLAREFASLTNALLGAATVGDVLSTVVGAASAVIPTVHMASVTMRSEDGSHHTPVGTEPAAAELDQAQYRSGRGPCIDATRLHGPALAASDDLSTDGRWPEFAAASTSGGFRSVLASALFPDPGPERRAGALNLWSRDLAAFEQVDRDRALLLATHASLALATTSAVSAAELERSQFRAAIDSRDVIGQAKGILMARRGLSAEDAFDVLRRTSQDINVKLVDLARSLAANPSGLDDA